MKISKNQLKSMIMEELQSVLSEQEPLPGPGSEPLYTSDEEREKAAAAAAPAAPATNMPAVGVGGPKIYSGGYRYTRNPDGSFTAFGADLPAAGRRFSADSRAGRSIAAEIGGGVYDPKQQMFIQRATAADVLPGADVSTSYRPAPEDPFGGVDPFQDFMPDYTKRQARAMARGERAASGAPINLGRAGRRELRSQFKGVPRRSATTVNIDDIASARTPARRDIEEMIYEALLEEFGDK